MTKQHWLHTSVLAVAEHYWHSIKVLFYFSFFLLSSYSEEARGAQEHWRGHKQNSWSKLIKRIFHNERCHTQQEKIEERRRKEEIVVFISFVFLSVYYMCPASWEISEHLPANGKQWMSTLFCFACTHSFTSLTCLPFNPLFSTFTPLTLSHILLWDSEWAVGWVAAAGWVSAQ